MMLLVVAVTAGNYARTAIGPLQETIRSTLGLSDNQIALLQGPAIALPVMLAAVPLGFLVDRYSRVRLLLVLSSLHVVGSLLTAWASGFAVLVAARCLIGLTATATLTAVFSLLADIYPPEQRGRATSVLVVSQMAGNSAAFALGGVVLGISETGPNGWRSAMFWLTCPLVLVMFAILMLREPTREHRRPESQTVLAAWRELWHYRYAFTPVLTGMVLVEMTFGAVYVWAAPVLSRCFHLSSERVGVIMAIALLASGVLGPIVGGTLADLGQRTGGPRRTMGIVSGLVALSIPAALFGFLRDAATAATLLVVYIVIVSATIVTGTTLFTIVVPNRLRGLCISILFGSATLFGLGLAPPAVSLLSGAMGGSAMIGRALSLLAATTGLLGAAAFILGRRSIQLNHDEHG